MWDGQGCHLLSRVYVCSLLLFCWRSWSTVSADYVLLQSFLRVCICFFRRSFDRSWASVFPQHLSSWVFMLWGEYVIEQSFLISFCQDLTSIHTLGGFKFSPLPYDELRAWLHPLVRCETHAGDWPGKKSEILDIFCYTRPLVRFDTFIFFHNLLWYTLLGTLVQ